jgi:NAD+ kinase
LEPLKHHHQGQHTYVRKPLPTTSSGLIVKLRKVLIVPKKSTYQIQAVEHKEANFLKLLEEGHSSVTKVKLAHEEHMETLQHLLTALDQRGVEHREVVRAELEGRIKGVDMVISVGGDGTFLDASHHVDSLPLLGINSSRSSSFGHFCLASLKNIEKVLDDIENDNIKTIKLLRLELLLNGKVLPDLVLNEVLIAHSNPAATSRFIVHLRGISEEQKSSGIWVSTPCGSTGSMRSAGGTVLPINDQRYQFIVREACMRPNEKWQLTRGILERNEEMRFVSQTRTGTLFIDGQHIEHHFGLGDELIIRASEHDLNAYANADVNDIFV